MKLFVIFLLGVVVGALPVYAHMKNKVEIAEFGEMLANKVLDICVGVERLKETTNELTK